MDRYRLMDAENDEMGIIMKATDQQTGQPVIIHKLKQNGRLKEKLSMVRQNDDLLILDYFQNTQFLYVVLEFAQPLSIIGTFSQGQILEILLQLLQLFRREGNPSHPLYLKDGTVKVYRMVAIDQHPLYTAPQKRHRILKNLKKNDQQIVWQMGVRTFQYLTGQKYTNDYETSYNQMMMEIEQRIRNQDGNWQIYSLLKNMLKYSVQDRINCKMVEYSLKLLKSKNQKNMKKSAFHSHYENTVPSQHKKVNYSRSFKQSSKIQFPKYKKRLHMNLFNCLPQTPKSVYSTWTRASPVSSFSNSTDMFKRLKQYEQKKFKKEIEHLQKLRMPRKSGECKKSSSGTFRSKVKSSTPREVKITPRQVKITPRQMKITPRQDKMTPREVKITPRQEQPPKPRQLQTSKLSTKQSMRHKQQEDNLEEISLQRQPMKQVTNVENKEVKNLVRKGSIQICRNVRKEDTNKIQDVNSKEKQQKQTPNDKPIMKQLEAQPKVKPKETIKQEPKAKEPQQIISQPARLPSPPKLEKNPTVSYDQPLINKTIQELRPIQQPLRQTTLQKPVQKHQQLPTQKILQQPADKPQEPSKPKPQEPQPEPPAPPPMKMQSIQQSQIQPKQLLRIYNILGETVKHANLNMKQQRNTWFIPSFFIYKCYLSLRKRFIDSFRQNLQPKVIEQIQKQNSNIQVGIDKMHKSIQPAMMKEIRNYDIVNTQPLGQNYKRQLLPILCSHFKTVESTVNKSRHLNIDPLRLKQYMRYVCLMGCSIVVIDQNHLKNRLNVRDLLDAAKKKIDEGRDWQTIVQEIMFKVDKISY